MKNFFLSNILVLFLFSASAQNWDIRLLDKINVEERPQRDLFFKGLSGSVMYVNTAVPIALLAAGNFNGDVATSRNAYYTGASILTTALFTTVLKYSVHRKRPFVENSFITKKTDVGPLSFPSGHTSSAFAMATSLSLAYPKWYVIAPSFLWASGVAYSRMYLGVHFPSDVLGGMVVGIGVPLILWEIQKSIPK